MTTLYRDDDPNLYTDLHLFRELHKRFISKNTNHHVGIIMKDLWQNQGMVYYLATAPYLVPCLHGWEHKDYSKLSYGDCYHDLSKSLDYWNENSKRMTGRVKPIEIFFAPWNREGDHIKQVCQDLKLQFCAVKEGAWNGYYIQSFHWWGVIDNPPL
jgi:hypothetical protein